MAETIDLDSEGNPTGTTSASPKEAAATAMSTPVRINLQTTVQSPFFWIVVGVGIAAVSYWFIKKKMD